MDEDMFLRISPETALKKMTVGMYEKIFEVAKDFRNEGSDPSHHQEFTMIEHYACYRDYHRNMTFTEQMFQYIFQHMPELSPVIMVKDKQGVARQVDFSKPRAKIDYIQQIKIDSGIDVSTYAPSDEGRLREDILAKGHHREGIHEQTTATMIDYLYKKVTRPKIVGPAFIYNYPKTMQPLARVSDADSNIVEQRQLLINGREVIKAYSELVDPILQQANFDEQASAAAAGDDEATKGDEEFVKAMEYGMPPQSGRGM
jgi:lysyl-tRNA synthetase class 2